MINVVSGNLIVPSEVRAQVREMFVGGTDLESIMRWLRDAGQYQGQTYKLLREECGLSYVEAKSTIHESVTWANFKEATERLHDTAYQAAIEAGFVETGAQPQSRTNAGAHRLNTRA